MNIRKWAAIVTLTAGSILGLSQLPPMTAHAATVAGECQVVNGGANQCWRSSYQSGVTVAWARDISGDPEQQWDSYDVGSVSSTGCLYNLPSTVQNAFANNRVVDFRDANNYYVGAGYHAKMGEDPAGNASTWYDFFTYAGNGALVNCGQSQYWKQLDFLCHASNTVQLWVNGNCGTISWARVQG